MTVKVANQVNELDRWLERVPARFLVGFNGELFVDKATIQQVHFVATRIITVRENPHYISPETEEFLILAEQNHKHEIYRRLHGLRAWNKYGEGVQGDPRLPHLPFYNGLISQAVFDYDIQDKLQELDSQMHQFRNLIPKNLPFPPAVTAIVLSYHSDFPTKEEENTAERLKQIRIAVFATFKHYIYEVEKRPSPPIKKPHLLALRKDLGDPNDPNDVVRTTDGLMRIANIVGEYLDGTGEDVVPAVSAVQPKPATFWDTLSALHHRLGRLLL